MIGGRIADEDLIAPNQRRNGITLPDGRTIEVMLTKVREWRDHNLVQIRIYRSARLPDRVCSEAGRGEKGPSCG